MPAVARFRGITVEVYYYDHPPPHVHARVGGHDVVLAVAGGQPVTIVAGGLPTALENRLLSWAALHQAELENAWSEAHRGYPPQTVRWP